MILEIEHVVETGIHVAAGVVACLLSEVVVIGIRRALRRGASAALAHAPAAVRVCWDPLAGPGQGVKLPGHSDLSPAKPVTLGPASAFWAYCGQGCGPDSFRPSVEQLDR